MNRNAKGALMGLLPSLILSVGLPAWASEGRREGAAVSGGEVSFHLGVFEPRGSSQHWEESERIFTQETTDFADLIGGVSVASYLNRHLDFVVGSQLYDATTRVRYRDIFRASGRPIRQDHRLRLLPFDVSLKLLPVPREVSRGSRGRTSLRPVVPYLGGGGGALLWDYTEEGLFVDDPDDPLFAFNDKRKARGITGSYHAFAGVEVQFTREFALWTEARYRWAKDDLDREFGESRFDLGGGALLVGGSIRF